MAPSPSRLLLAWSFPTIAVLLSYLWFKRKRIGARSDPGGTEQPPTAPQIEKEEEVKPPETMKEELVPTAPVPITQKSFSRSLSGVESAPIDIIIPRDLRSTKSNPLHVSDEDLDAQIEKVRPPKNSTDNYKLTKQLVEKASISPVKTPPKSPMLNNNNNLNSSKKKTTKPKKQLEKVTKKNLINNENIENPVEDSPTKKIETKKRTSPKAKKGDDNKKPIAHTSSLNINCKDFVPKSLENIGSSLKIEKTESDNVANRQRSVSNDRDSANHSPVDPLLASPSLSNISDQDSLDSGKGGSGSEIIGSPPHKQAPKKVMTVEESEANSEEFEEPQSTQELIAPVPTIYDFLLPQDIVGKFIGKGGYAINELKKKSSTSIVIRAHPHNKDFKVCVIEGYQQNIDSALKIIRDKFPQKKYPAITLEQSYLAIPPNYQLNTDCLYLRLIQGINNDTVISCIVKPNYLFVQQYTHPTYLTLQSLTQVMNEEYSKAESPLVAFPAAENSVCGGYSVNQWYRVLILSNDAETQKAYVAFLDYGGYAFIDYCNLRQIRADFLMLPFQAQGCILNGIKPAGDDWDKEAYDEIGAITVGNTCITQITGSTSWDEPLVNIFVRQRNGEWLNLSDELVHRGYAKYADDEHCHPLWVKCMEEVVSQTQPSESEDRETATVN